MLNQYIKVPAIVLLSVFLCLSLEAQPSKHMIEVSHLDGWHSKYLTVTCDNKIGVFEPKGESTWFYDISRRLNSGSKELAFSRNTDISEKDAILLGDIRNADIVTEINGQSTEGMDETVFYEILDSCDKASLSILRRVGATIVPKTVSIEWNTSKQSDLKAMMYGKINEQPNAEDDEYRESVRKKYRYRYNDAFDKASRVLLNGEPYYYYPIPSFTALFPAVFLPEGEVLDSYSVSENKYYSLSGTDVPSIKALQVSIDKDFDWFNVMRYDCVYNGAFDKSLIDLFVKIINDKNIDGASIIKWVRDENQPDIIIRIATDDRQSTNTVYIPEQTQYVQTGSEIRAKYNYQGFFQGYDSHSNVQQVTTGGYSVDVSNADLFFEISILDAEKMRQHTSNAPIVWQGQWREHFSKEVTAQKIYQNLIHVLAGSFTPEPKRIVNMMHHLVPEPFRINYKKRVVEWINHGSIWYSFGLREGDEIISCGGGKDRIKVVVDPVSELIYAPFAMDTRKGHVRIMPRSYTNEFEFCNSCYPGVSVKRKNGKREFIHPPRLFFPWQNNSSLYGIERINTR